ncbi:hypothetical protein RND81_11G202300 [Saponaria officinalis]|uniref:Uncharacterized protein n=2 Tax=Saponaria officinalis TaxID=3572 RepID=A0AAW1HQ35_SAPOF
MDVSVDQHLLSQDSVLQKENSEAYTGDGSVDFQGNPVLKRRTGNWRACPFILVNEFCERIAFHSVDTNLVNYLRNKLHLGNVSAARTVTTWSGTCYLTPLIGAFLADGYLGKYWTIATFSVIHFIGMSALTLSASVPALRPSECVGSICPSATSSQYAILFVGLYLVALGAGGIKPCVSSFGADQFDDTDHRERAGKVSFFNWFYFSISIGCLVSSIFVVWIQENVGWSIGFGIPALFMGISIAIFFCGTSAFRFQKPGGSPLERICQVVVASLRKCNLEVPQDVRLLYETPENGSAITGSRKLEHTEELTFLDKAAVMSASEKNSEQFSKWRLCTVTQVEELKILIRMFPIWATSIIFSSVYAQMSTMFVEQGMVMDRKLGSYTIPAASLSTFEITSILLWIILYEKAIMPIVRKFTSKETGFTNLQRMGIGLFLSMLPMVAAALLEIKRLRVAENLGLIDQNVAVPLSIFWQFPQYFLVGPAEIFFYIAKMEFFYDESPDAMRSFCTALSLLTTALGNYLNSLMLTVVSVITTSGGKPGWIPDNLNQGQLYHYFWLWAGLSFLNLLVFVYCAKRYKQKKTS